MSSSASGMTEAADGDTCPAPVVAIYGGPTRLRVPPPPPDSAHGFHNGSAKPCQIVISCQGFRCPESVRFPTLFSISMCASSGHVPQPTRTHTPLAAVVQKGKMIAIVPPADRPRLVLTWSPLARKWQFAGRHRDSPKRSRLLKPYRRNRQFGAKCLAGEFLEGNGKGLRPAKAILVGAPGRTRTCAPTSGGRLSEPSRPPWPACEGCQPHCYLPARLCRGFGWRSLWEALESTA
jgi:hypothetical protein